MSTDFARKEDMKMVTRPGERANSSVKGIIFFKTVEKLAKERGYTISRLSKELGVTRATFTYWKHGRNAPSPSMQLKIADFFGMKVEDFEI